MIALGYSLAALLVFGPWILGAFFGWRWGRTWHGTVEAVGLGFVLAAGVLGVFVLTFSAADEAACGRYECVEYFGRWLDVWSGREWPLYVASAWTLCAVGFSWMRRRQEAADEPASMKAAAFELFSTRGRMWVLVFLAAVLFVHLLYINVLYEGMATRMLVLVSVTLCVLGFMVQGIRRLGRIAGSVFRSGAG